MPYDSVTGDVDTAAVSADGSVYTEPKYMTVIVTGASGDIEGDDKYTQESPSYTGTENYGWGIVSSTRSASVPSTCPFSHPPPPHTHPLRSSLPSMQAWPPGTSTLSR